ncbi:hypothetical protein V2J09_015364 [Rumex salicifolius]
MRTLPTFSHGLRLPSFSSTIAGASKARPNSLNPVHRSCRRKTRCNSSKPELNTNHPRVVDSSPPIIHRIACGCGRRRFMETVGTSVLIPAISPCACSSSPIPDSSKDELKKFHPPKPDWYEELYASVLNKFMKSYEAEVEGYKSKLFDQLRGKAKDILEIGIGTGPNLKFYAGDAGVNVVGADPNKKMEKYARAAAEATGLPPANFQFVQAVGEALPLADASVDAVIGTLVLCSVSDVNRTLEEIKRVLRPGGLYLFLEHVGAKDGTVLRFAQNVLNPLQKLLADGCHLTRETGNCIAEAGFSELDSNIVFVSKASLVNPQVYGIARK